MPSELFKLEKQGDIAVITLAPGDMFHEENDRLMKSFDDLMNKGTKKFVLDLTDTNYISSLIVASMVYIHKRAQDAGGAMVFCNIKNRVKEILGMTNLDKVFQIAGNREEALNVFKKKSK